MVPGGFGHGTSHCKHCFATEREIAFALGPVCSSAPTPPSTPSQRLDAATVEREALAERIRAAVTYQYMPMAVRKLLSEAAAALATEPHQHGGKGA